MTHAIAPINRVRLAFSRCFLSVEELDEAFSDVVELSGCEESVNGRKEVCSELASSGECGCEGELRYGDGGWVYGEGGE